MNTFWIISGFLLLELLFIYFIDFKYSSVYVTAQDRIIFVVLYISGVQKDSLISFMFHK